jgi:hypothetical protein
MPSTAPTGVGLTTGGGLTAIGLSTQGLMDSEDATPVAAVLATEVRRLGRDLDVPLDEDESIRVTPTGDLPTLAGRPNVHAAQRRRALVAPGSLVHRAEYGGGLVLEISQPGTLTRYSQIANRLRRNALRDPRISEARVEVSGGPPADLLVGCAIRIRGDETDEQFDLSLAE